MPVERQEVIKFRQLQNVHTPTWTTNSMMSKKQSVLLLHNSNIINNRCIIPCALKVATPLYIFIPAL